MNLSIQVLLALYAFWKLTGRHNLKILAPAILAFLAGIMRYGERTWALKCNSRNGLRETRWQLQKLEVEADKGSYVSIILYVLSSMPGVRDLFSGRTVSQMKVREAFKFQADSRPLDQVLKLLEVELAMMYDDLYTKAMVLRTRTGVILRCISQILMTSAFFIFIFANSRQYYSRADVAITYVLFIGCFTIEVCAFILMVMSPWTWAFFESRKCGMLAHVTWLIVVKINGAVQLPELLYRPSSIKYIIQTTHLHQEGVKCCRKQVFSQKAPPHQACQSKQGHHGGRCHMGWTCCSRGIYKNN
jgi:hypothetical protein